MDSGVFAPVLTFQKLFEAEGVPVTDDEVRGPMGVHKRVRILRIISRRSLHFYGRDIIDHQGCKLKCKLRELTSCLCCAASVAVCVEGCMAGLDATETENELSQPTIEFTRLFIIHHLKQVEELVIQIFLQPSQHSPSV